MTALRKTLAALLFAAAAHAAAQTYPSKPIRWIVAFPPGGGADTFSRMLSPKISEALGQPIVIDNRTGAGGNIGADAAAKSPPDGYTILFGFLGTHAINPSLYKMPFQQSDLAPIIQLASTPLMLVVHPSIPATNVSQLIAAVKAQPGQLLYGSTGSGAHNHLAGELFKMLTKTDMVHVPYKGGGPAAIALLSGEVGVLFAEPASIVAHVKAGKVRALAVTSAKRSVTAPGLPTVGETVPGYEVTSWNGMLIPAGTPPEIIRRLNAEFNKVIAIPDMRDKMIANGFEPVGGTPERFGDLIRTETVKWAKVVKAANMKID